MMFISLIFLYYILYTYPSGEIELNWIELNWIELNPPVEDPWKIREEPVDDPLGVSWSPIHLTKLRAPYRRVLRYSTHFHVFAKTWLATAWVSSSAPPCKDLPVQRLTKKRNDQLLVPPQFHGKNHKNHKTTGISGREEADPLANGLSQSKIVAVVTKKNLCRFSGRNENFHVRFSACYAEFVFGLALVTLNSFSV